MNRELLVKLLTGLVAKLLRYAIAAVGGSAAIHSVEQSQVDTTQLAAGIAGLLVSVGWSVWEDRTKAKAKAKEPGNNEGTKETKE